MKRFNQFIGLFLLLTVLFVAAGCDLVGKNKGQTPPPGTKNVNVVVYYLKDTQYNSYLVREIHSVKKTNDMPRTAVEELINGIPATSEAYKVLPTETKVLGVKVDEKGLATVDFSPEALKANVGSSGEVLGIASIVNTLTEFPHIIKVSFTVNGKAENAMDWWGHVGLSEQPFSRNMSLVQEPAIWVTAPIANQTIDSPLKISGSAMVFEATVSYRLKDAQNNILASGFTTAASGAPERGDFTADIQFKSPGAGLKGQLEVYEESMKDGSDTNKVIIPIVFK